MLFKLGRLFKYNGNNAAFGSFSNIELANAQNVVKKHPCKSHKDFKNILMVT